MATASPARNGSGLTEAHGRHASVRSDTNFTNIRTQSSQPAVHYRLRGQSLGIFGSHDHTDAIMTVGGFEIKSHRLALLLGFLFSVLNFPFKNFLVPI